MKRRLCSLCVATACMLATSLPAFSGTITVSSAAAAARVRLQVQAGRFLDIATFGAKKTDVNTLVQRMEQIGVEDACEEWIDSQLALQPTLLGPLSRQMMADDGIDPLQTNAWVQRYRHHAFWHNAIAAPDQLQQRLAWALIQICVLNDSVSNNVAMDASGNPSYLGVQNYYDGLLTNSTASYSDVLSFVTKHPCMGVYLSHLRNRKADAAGTRFPDENYAREIMQLFSIGLYELRPDGEIVTDAQGEPVQTYDNETIKSFARVFTGFRYAGTSTSFWSPQNLHEPMEMYEAEHDTDPKVLLNGTVLPGNRPGMQDVDDAIANLATHSSTGPFIGRRLIQRLVKSNPSRAYLSRVSQAYVSSNGDMKAVVKAILLDPEVFSAVSFTTQNTGPGVWEVTVSNNGTEHSRLQEPMVRYTAFLRKFDGQPDYPTGRVMLADMKYFWTQGYMASPSVFNFWLPDFQTGEMVSYETSGSVPNGFLAAPEFEIHTAVVFNRLANWYRTIVYGEVAPHTLLNNGTYNFRNNMTLDFSEEKALAVDPVALVSHLNLLMANGNWDNEFCQTMIDAVTEETSDPTARTRAAILSGAVAPLTANPH